MDGFPLQAFVFTALGLAVTAWMLRFQRKRMRDIEGLSSQFRAGELAKELGLRLVHGSPDYNLSLPLADAGVEAGLASGDLEVKLQLAGERQGLPLALDYSLRSQTEAEHYVGEQGRLYTGAVAERRWFDCRLVAQAAAAFPPFEAHSLVAPLGPIARQLALPQLATGSPAVDASYAVYTQEPGMARCLGELLPSFADFGFCGVHLVGDGRTVAFVMNDRTAPLLTNALSYAALLADKVVAAARVVGG